MNPVRLYEHRPEKILITGTSGSGKTTLWLKLMSLHRARYKFVFDHEGEVSFKLKCLPAMTPEQMHAQTAQGCCLYDPARMFPGRLLEAFDFFCDYVFTLSQRLPGVKLLSFDEGQKLNDPNSVSQFLSCCLDTGRRCGLDLFLISQAPNLMHNRVRNQLTKVITFRQADLRAVQFLSDVGFSPDLVRALPPGRWLSRDLNTGQESGGEVFKAGQKK